MNDLNEDAKELISFDDFISSNDDIIFEEGSKFFFYQNERCGYSYFGELKNLDLTQKLMNWHAYLRGNSWRCERNDYFDFELAEAYAKIEELKQEIERLKGNKL